MEWRKVDRYRNGVRLEGSRLLFKLGDDYVGFFILFFLFLYVFGIFRNIVFKRIRLDFLDKKLRSCGGFDGYSF